MFSGRRKYTYNLTPSDLGGSEVLSDLVEDSFCVAGTGSAAQGLQELQAESLRDFKLNNKPVPRELTADTLDEMFPGQSENLLKHFTQAPLQFAARSPMGASLFSGGSLPDVARLNQVYYSVNYVDPRKDLNPRGHVYYDPKKDTIFYDATVRVPLANFPGHDPSSKKATEVFIRFKLLKPKEETPDENGKKGKKGFELVGISTNDCVVRDLFVGKVSSSLSLSLSRRLILKWRAVSTSRKIVAGVGLLAGAAALVFGVFFPPSLIVSLPLVGKLAATPLLIYGGAGLAGSAVAKHVTDVFLPKQHFLQRWRAMGRGPKIAAALTALVGIGALIGGIFCPPSLIVTLPLMKSAIGLNSLLGLGGLALAGMTCIGHAIHIRRTSLSAREGKKDPRSIKHKSIPTAHTSHTDINDQLGIAPGNRTVGSSFVESNSQRYSGSFSRTRWNSFNASLPRDGERSDSVSRASTGAEQRCRLSSTSRRR